jgi:hypothetical protein
MLESKDGAYPSGKPLGFNHILTTLERHARDKHSSLYLTLINYSHKRLYNIVL